jgi:hypothetical protein
MAPTLVPIHHGTNRKPFFAEYGSRLLLAGSTTSISRIAWKTIALGSVALADRSASLPISTLGYAKAHSCANSSFPWRGFGSKEGYDDHNCKRPARRASMED